MRRLLLTFGFLLTATGPALAVETAGDPSTSDMALASDYTHVAHAFGDFHLVWVGRSPAMLMAEYTGGGETADNWTRLVVAKFIAAPVDPDAHEKSVAQTIAGWRARLENKTDYPLKSDLISFALVDHPAAIPGGVALHGAIFHYRVGTDDKHEDDIGIVHPLANPPGVVILQYQTRGGATITGDDMTRMRRVLNWALSTLNAEPVMSKPMSNTAQAKGR